MMKTATAAVIACLIFAGCGGAPNFVLNQNYENQDFSDKVLLIAPIANDAVKIMNKDDVEDDFPNDKREPEVIIQGLVYNAVMNFAREHLTGVKVFKTELDTSLFLSQYDKSKYFRLSQPLDNDEVLPFFYIPKKEILSASNIKPDLILVMNRLKFGRGAITNYKYSMPALKAEFEYILYDYNKNEVVAIGGSTADTPFGFAMTRSTWDINTKNIAPEFFKKLPFHISNR